MDSSGAVITRFLKPVPIKSTTPPTETDARDVESSSSTVPSSPPLKDAHVFSDNALLDTDSDLSSPPSSPPVPLPSPALPAHRSAFSFLKRKRSCQEPMTAIDHNARKIPRPAKQASLKQMQIDLGGEIRKTCGDCGMEYIPSVSEDSALHREFHNMNKQGVDAGKTLMRDAATNSVLPARRRLQRNEAILMIDRRSSVGSRNKVKKILEVVNSELSATEIEDKYLWGRMISITRAMPTRKTGNEESIEGIPRFKAFVYLVSERCVGFCLVEKIGSAHRVIDSSVTESAETHGLGQGHSSSISISDKQDVALLGISRIWTSRSHRRQGIASTLLECARRHFFYGMEVTKDLVAFSQPTDSGGKLAKRWFEAMVGWHVYQDGN